MCLNLGRCRWNSFSCSFDLKLLDDLGAFSGTQPSILIELRVL